MANIFDRGSTWELEIFPGIETVEIIDEPTKGYRAVLGFDPDSGRHVVANVVYNKNMYSIDDVMLKVESLRTCETCDTLDRERLRLESIHVPSTPTPVQQAVTAASITQPVIQPVPFSVTAPPDIKDMFANIIMDAYLTNPGKYFLGLMLDDQTLMQSAYPDKAEDMGMFMEDMIDFMSGETEFMRSPDEAREFLSVMKTDEAAGAKGVTTTARKRLPVSTDAIVIY